jgi:hypothetical protein
MNRAATVYSPYMNTETTKVHGRDWWQQRGRISRGNAQAIKSHTKFNLDPKIVAVRPVGRPMAHGGSGDSPARARLSFGFKGRTYSGINGVLGMETGRDTRTSCRSSWIITFPAMIRRVLGLKVIGLINAQCSRAHVDPSTPK